MRLDNHLLLKYGAAILISSLLMTSCSKNDAGNQAGQQMPPLPVNIHKVQKRDIPITLEYPARIKSVQQVQVVARVPGTLEKKFFKEGSFVSEGTLLYQIDPSRYEAVYELALAQLNIAEATAKEAERNWQRVEKLYEQNALSQREYDIALSAYETTQAQVKAAEAAVKNAKVDLDYTQIKATASGSIGQNLQDIGSYVGTAATNSLLTIITQSNPIYAEFALSDMEVLKKRYTLSHGSWQNITAAKLPVKIVTPAGDAYEQLGVFDFLDNLVDPQTATIKARATFDNKEGILIPGLFVRVVIEGLVQKDTYAIPQKAVMQDPSGSYIYVMREGKAAKLPIKIDNTIRNSEVVVLDGLKGDEEIILDNLTKIRPGSPVMSAEDFGKMMAARAANTSKGQE
ncbi:MAG: efflux RND transporter periplasmic adaptor subunit [Campylobacteraceae bacterium]|nr:efflux RND transporter periplasmic adaptor subunit [Campylobacteraceae bacterium]